MMSPTGNKKAFTLIEVMVTTVVLSLLTILIYQAFFISVDTFNYYYDYLNVASLADETLWQAQDDLTHFGNLSNRPKGGEFIIKNKDFKWEVSTGLIDKDALVKLYKIDLVVFWKEGKRQASLSRTAYAMYVEEQK